MHLKNFKNIIGVLTLGDTSFRTINFKSLNTIIDLTAKNGLTLLQNQVKEMEKVCDKIYLILDEALDLHLKELRDFCRSQNIQLVLLPDLNAYFALYYVSSRSLKEDLIFFRNLAFVPEGSVDFSSMVRAVDHENSIYQTFIATASLHQDSTRKNYSFFEFNMKSFHFSDCLQPGFVSESGSLLKWTGILFFKNCLFADLVFHSGKAAKAPEPFLIQSEKFGYTFPVHSEARSLKELLGIAFHSPLPLRMAIHSYPVYNLMNEHDYICYTTTNFDSNHF